MRFDKHAQSAVVLSLFLMDYMFSPMWLKENLKETCLLPNLPPPAPEPEPGQGWVYGKGKPPPSSQLPNLLKEILTGFVSWIPFYTGSLDFFSK